MAGNWHAGNSWSAGTSWHAGEQSWHSGDSSWYRRDEEVDEAPQTYAANPVNFDGTNDWLSRGAGLTDAADSKLWTGSFWIRRTGTTGAEQHILRDINQRAWISFLTTDRIRVRGLSAAPATVFNIEGAFGTDTAWHHVMFSTNQGVANARYMYLDGTSVALAVTHTDAEIDFTHTNWGIGSRHDGSQGKLPADVADFQMWIGVHVDLTEAANRELFLKDGKPVDPAVAATALGNPIIRLSGATDDWHTNKGTGGGFAENGELTNGTGAVGL